MAAPMLLWPSMGFAYLSAPLSPLYAVESKDSNRCLAASITFVNSQPNPATCNEFIGYVNTTQMPGTSPVYLVIPFIDGRCLFNYATITNSPSGPCSRFIGYVNTTQIVGTSPVYLTVLRNYTTGACIYPGAFGMPTFTSSPNGPCSRFIGYVYPTLPAPVTFTTYPKYFIGSVIYVPPGAGSSSITYGAGTVTGTTMSTTSSWSQESSVGVQIGSPDGFSVTFGDNFGGSTMHSVDMQQTVSQSTTYKAPPSDSINHDYDQIQLFLGVNVIASVDYLGNVTWSTDFSQIAAQGFAETGYPISVGCLRPNSTIPSFECTATVNFLSSVGITSADYPNILGADPFADPSASPTPDPSRYVPIDSVFYLPDPTATTFTYTENNSTTITNSMTSSYSYSVSAGASASYDGVSLKDSTKFTWTNSSTLSNKTGSTNSSAFTLSMPSFTYSGPNTLFVYLDTIYKTFMFSFQ